MANLHHHQHHFLNPQAQLYIPISRKIFYPFVYPQTHYYTLCIPPPPPAIPVHHPPKPLLPPPPQPVMSPTLPFPYTIRGRNKWKTLSEIIPLKQDEHKTTVMIKNIPNKYTRQLLIVLLEKHCSSENHKLKDLGSSEDEISAFDFIYLPMDFRSGVNKGYAFVNFTNPKAVWKFYNEFAGNKWELFESPKKCEIVSAKLQGKTALVNHFSKSSFTCQSDEFLPLCFNPPNDGSNSVKLSSTVGTYIWKKH